jgi:hypothetical protein
LDLVVSKPVAGERNREGCEKPPNPHDDGKFSEGQITAWTWTLFRAPNDLRRRSRVRNGPNTSFSGSLTTWFSLALRDLIYLWSKEKKKGFSEAGSSDLAPTVEV